MDHAIDCPCMAITYMYMFEGFSNSIVQRNNNTIDANSYWSVLRQFCEKYLQRRQVSLPYLLDFRTKMREMNLAWIACNNRLPVSEINQVNLLMSFLL
jgi:hypothetical protein